MRSLKYLTAFQIPVLVYLSLVLPGWWSFLVVGYLYGIVPIIDELLPRSALNMSAAEEEAARTDRLYDVLLYAMVPFQVALLLVYLQGVASGGLTPVELVGNTLSMGVSNASLSINIGHELGHRASRFERFLAKTLLLTSLNLHFVIEHNLGHHKRVATDDDPASARYGQTVYTFVPRSMWLSYLSAWNIERERRAKRKLPFFSPGNEMIQSTLIQAAALGAAWAWGGWLVAVAYLASALHGQAQLEVINYIEHYGLSRGRREDGRYERVSAHHSWNSNHAFGRLLLFELTRHSDHHYQASRPYQILRDLDKAPQMPAGYPAMMVMSMFSPLWFRVMNPRAERTMLAHYDSVTPAADSSRSAQAQAAD